ncbi:CLUMA_CG010178, isoform A [Clunio marinus]|uniref:CLUMA_CG010178, isoform A n=1 Tax=Clunio marinus TaxID=568069 RepID=A0A1J1IC00_9DIPT|nr:CLUMA_CG010178, isoform A [Clunio marinus]
MPEQANVEQKNMMTDGGKSGSQKNEMQFSKCNLLWQIYNEISSSRHNILTFLRNHLIVKT